MMLIDKGLNDRWTRPAHWRRVGPNRYRVSLKETLGKNWAREIVSFPLPPELKGKRVEVTWNRVSVPSQVRGSELSVLVQDLRAGEEREYEAVAAVHDRRSPVIEPSAALDRRYRFERRANHAVFSNGILSLKLPAKRTSSTLPGPILAVRRGNGPWVGRGRLESSFAVRSIQTRLIERGELWATAEVRYTFEGDHTYRVRIQLRPGEDAAEIFEESTLPVRLWPAPRPYKEIGSLGKSFWDQPVERIANPCTRPCPTSNFLFDLRPGLDPDRMLTHSTSSWEIMDMPLRAASLKTYTAMRPACPFIDGGWLGAYNSGHDDLFGVASIDIAHWKAPDDFVHPAHRTPGANQEVILVDSRADTHLRFPIENMTRRWLLVATNVGSWKDAPRFRKRARNKPLRLDPDSSFPLWAMRIRRGDLRLDKVKDWIVDWPDAGVSHPRVLCRRSDFASIRQKMKTVPEFRRNHAKYKPWRGADEYILSGKKCSLAQVEAQTNAKKLVEGILAGGFAGPTYCIGFARPLRRYAIACDILWDSFTRAEKREARRVCALAAYILSDGDFWQYAYRPNETTYLPNFNTDEFACTGILGLFLSDHPCSKAWIQFCTDRLEIELKNHLRRDGGGEENVGSYYFSTWTQLYMPMLWALRHCGVKDYSGDPRVLGGGRYMLKVYGPPEPRAGGLRAVPPIGNHPHIFKAMPVFDWLASFVKKADPTLASNLKWAWRTCGSPVGNLHDHFGPTANVFTRHYLMHDRTIRAVEPKLGSYNLPQVGAVLRSHGNTTRGTYLFIKAGRVHSHHDDDEGAFHYHGRGIPLAVDGLPIQNGATAEQHNAVTFSKPGQPSGLVERFRTTPLADYVRARIGPRAFCCDSMYVDDNHRSGWEREIVLVKADKPGGIEYLVIKDTCTGPDPCQWNLDVLSRKPQRTRDGRLWFPGHPELGMGLDVIFVEPSRPVFRIEPGIVNPALFNARERRKLSVGHIAWKTTEHWLLHVPATPGTTFAAVLFPRRASEKAPVVEYLTREESICIRHDEGCDVVFLRPNREVGTSLDGAVFRGRAGIFRKRRKRSELQALDAETTRVLDYPDRIQRVL